MSGIFYCTFILFRSLHAQNRMTMNLLLRSSSPRIDVVDALRGFAVFSIMLLHHVEHFDLYYFPDSLPEWVKSTDRILWDALFFLFSGKSYAIFALLFGLTFFIQSENQAKKGSDFRGRFAWRLVLLMFFALLNSLFYQGDILTLYAAIGFVLLPVATLSSRTVFFIALFLMLQPLEWINFFTIYLTPDYIPSEPVSNAYFAQTGEYLMHGSFWTAVQGNLTTGKLAVIHWSWENGRFFQTASLFMTGMLIGRNGFFLDSENSTSSWKKVLAGSAVSFVPLFFLRYAWFGWGMREAPAGKLAMIVTSWSNFAFMLVLVSGFVLLYRTAASRRLMENFIPFGRMSLSNYVIQSIVGAFIYYGYGLALYQYTGATYSILIGSALFVLQLWFCRWWLHRNKQGPLEYLWHRATWI